MINNYTITEIIDIKFIDPKTGKEVIPIQIPKSPTTKEEIYEWLNSGKEFGFGYGRSWMINNGRYYHENKNYHEAALTDFTFNQPCRYKGLKWDEVSKDYFYNTLNEEIERYSKKRKE